MVLAESRVCANAQAIFPCARCGIHRHRRLHGDEWDRDRASACVPCYEVETQTTAKDKRRDAPV